MIVLLGVLIMLLGFYLMTVSKDVYFTAENVTLSPGEARDIMVVPNAEIVLEYRDLPLCQGARLIFFDHTGKPVYEVSGFGNADRKIPNNCNTGECIYKVRYDLPRDCIQELQNKAKDIEAHYSLVVYSKTTEWILLLIMGAIFTGIGFLINNKKY